MANVLVVDDAAFLRNILKEILEGSGHHVLAEAADGLEAVGKYKTYRPDLVTMDITMPNMDGFEAIREIRKFDPNAKIIMCSAVGHKDQILKAIREGACDFLVKPFQRDRVLEAVDRAMSGNKGAAKVASLAHEPSAPFTYRTYSDREMAYGSRAGR